MPTFDDKEIITNEMILRHVVQKLIHDYYGWHVPKLLHISILM
jgi:hypothetical protein